MVEGHIGDCKDWLGAKLGAEVDVVGGKEAHAATYKVEFRMRQNHPE